MKLYKAPQPIEEKEGKAIFLAGSIDMGHAVNWQQTVTQYLRNKRCSILNPRRDDWDKSWDQSVDDPEFSKQVRWELDGMEKADIILMNFCEGSQSPVTLLELGLMARTRKLFVCCPPGFWRSGNVHIVCRRYQVPLFTDITTLLKTIDELLDQ